MQYLQTPRWIFPPRGGTHKPDQYEQILIGTKLCETITVVPAVPVVGHCPSIAPTLSSTSPVHDLEAAQV